MDKESIKTLLKLFASAGQAACMGSHIVQQLKLPTSVLFGGVLAPQTRGQDLLTGSAHRLHYLQTARVAGKPLCLLMRPA